MPEQEYVRPVMEPTPVASLFVSSNAHGSTLAEQVARVLADAGVDATVKPTFGAWKGNVEHGAEVMLTDTSAAWPEEVKVLLGEAFGFEEILMLHCTAKMSHLKV